MKIDRNWPAPWLNGRTMSWAGYDVASSVYGGVVPGVLAPLYIHELARDLPNPAVIWGVLSAIAVLVSCLAALAAAAAAARVSRLTVLVVLTAALVVAMVGLAWNPHASLAQASLAYVAAQSFYFAAMTIYESFLPDLVSGEERQKLSGFGWATGYLGGVVAIIVLLILVDGQPQSITLLISCFGALAVVSGLFFAIILLVMKNAHFVALQGEDGPPRIGSALEVVRNWRANRGVFRLLLGTMLIQMAIVVVVTFTTPILSNRFGQGLSELLWLLLIIHVLSVPSTLGWSHLMAGASRLRVTVFLLACWGLVLLLLAFGSGPWVPLITVVAIGCCLGATLSGLRGFLAEAVGQSNPVALFALATTAGRLASALGPALFVLILLVAGETPALLASLLVLCLGAIITLGYLSNAEPPVMKPAPLT
jgi:UMF1 family MFS transporter